MIGLAIFTGASALCGAAQSLGNAHRWQEAGMLMNQVNKMVPNSKEAAALRYAYWTIRHGARLAASIARVKGIPRTSG